MSPERREFLNACKVPGCGKPAKARGWCSAHYERWRMHGDPSKTLHTPHGEVQRYFREVVMAYEGDECLTWAYTKDRNGYGQMVREGRTWRVHRLVCVEAHGQPPAPDHEAAHSCGKGHLACVSKRHVSWKTRAENMADKVVHSQLFEANETELASIAKNVTPRGLELDRRH